MVVRVARGSFGCSTRSILTLKREEKAVDVPLVREAEAFDHDATDRDEKLESGTGVNAGHGGYDGLSDLEQRDIGNGDDVGAAGALIDKREFSEEVPLPERGQFDIPAAFVMNDAAGAVHHHIHAITYLFLANHDFPRLCREWIEQIEELAHFLVGEFAEENGMVKLLALFGGDHVRKLGEEY
jgi:hypothetical protein